MPLAERIASASAGARGAVVILSANPIHDTGGGQRSAQIALELLERGYCVVFVSHGRVTETVDLGLELRHDHLIEMGLREAASSSGRVALAHALQGVETTVLTQVPVRSWEPVLDWAAGAGAVTIYDCIDRWDSELGRGWYRPDAERRIARSSDVLVSSAAELVHHVEIMAEREAHLLPNAFNSRIFRQDVVPREPPADLPTASCIALYVGALWGGWLDWDLVGRAAAALPDTTFVFVGDHRGEGRGLPDNCVFLGLKPQTALPGYLAHADLAFLPWRANEVTQATSPLKVYEFVAMGLPVVAPAIETLRGIPGVALSWDGTDFVDLLRERSRVALTAETRTAMRSFADDNSWVQRVDLLLELTDEARRGTRRRGRRAGAAAGSRPVRGKRSRPATGGATVSVVIPAYNHERYVGAAVDSVRAQSLGAAEVVAVDDGSTDGTADVLAQHAFSSMRVLRQANRGAHAALNRAIALSCGDYIAVLNSDDAFTPERLEHAWGVVRHTGAALLVGSVRLVDEAGAPLEETHEKARWYREARSGAERARSLRSALLRHNFAVTTSNFFFHRELWRRLGGFAAYRYVHDLDFLLRALELRPDRVRYEPALDDVLYRVHGHNTISEDVGRALDERAGLLRALRRPLARLARARTRFRDAKAVRRAVDTSDALTPVPPSHAGEISRGSRLAASTVERSSSWSGSPISRSAAPARSRTTRSARRDRASLRAGLVVTSLDRGGLEEIVSLLAQVLPAHGVRPYVLCTHSGGVVADRLRSAGIPVAIANGRRSEWRAWAATVRPEVASTHFSDVEAVEELHALGIPLIETVHNTYAWFGPDDWAREARKATSLTATVAVSETVARYYARRCPAAPRPRVVPNAVQPGRAAVVPRGFARREHALRADAPVLVHPGRLSMQKNLSGLLAAFASVVECAPDASLVLAGPRHDRRYLRSVVRAHRPLVRNGSVRVLPPVPHVGTLLSAADAFVSNSFYEGWSVAASEAAWGGLPLVLSDCGGSRELIGEGDARGRLVPNPLGDPLEVTSEAMRNARPEAQEPNREALTAAMLDVIAGREAWAARRDEIRAHARRQLAPDRMADAYAVLLRGAAGRGTSWEAGSP